MSSLFFLKDRFHEGCISGSHHAGKDSVASVDVCFEDRSIVQRLECKKKSSQAGGAYTFHVSRCGLREIETREKVLLSLLICKQIRNV